MILEPKNVGCVIKMGLFSYNLIEISYYKDQNYKYLDKKYFYINGFFFYKFVFIKTKKRITKNNSA